MPSRIQPSLYAILALALSTAKSSAAEPFRWERIPKKDVMVFVDVSGSITPSASVDAGKLVKSIITGDLEPTRFPNWNLSVPSRYPHFIGILTGESLASGGTKGLMAAGQSFAIQKIGDYDRVQHGFGLPTPISTFPSEIDLIFANNYPTKPMDFVDQSTYLLLAKAKAAQKMKSTANTEGFYLFIISDDVDDSHLSYKADDEKFIESFYQETEQHKIAQLKMRDTSELEEIRRGSKTPIRGVPYPRMNQFVIDWYAVGPKEPKALEAPQAPPPPPPPVLPQWIQLLGGLGTDPAEPKVFATATPFLAWQVANVRGSQEFTVKVSPISPNKFSVSPPRPMKTRVDLARNYVASVQQSEREDGVSTTTGVPLEELDEGDYKIVIRPEGATDKGTKAASAQNPENLSVTTYIRIRKSFVLWPWLALAGALSGAGLFYHMWRTLNQNRPKKKTA